MLCEAFTESVFDFGESHILQFFDHRFYFGTLQSVCLGKLDCLLNFVDAALENYHCWPASLGLLLLHVVESTEVVDKYLLVLLLELVL